VRGSHSSTLTRDQPPASLPRAGAWGGIQEAVRSPRLAAHHLASPICGVAGEPASTHPRSYNPPRAPMWASVVRGEGSCVVENTCLQQQPAVTTADFTALYDRCLASGLKARVVFSYVDGHQTLSISCTFPAPASSPPLPESAAAPIAAVEGAVEPPPLRRDSRIGSHPLPPPPQLAQHPNRQHLCSHLKVFLPL
jgi:hypothetical protein